MSFLPTFCMCRRLYVCMRGGRSIGVLCCFTSRKRCPPRKIHSTTSSGSEKQQDIPLAFRLKLTRTMSRNCNYYSYIGSINCRSIYAPYKSGRRRPDPINSTVAAHVQPQTPQNSPSLRITIIPAQNLALSTIYTQTFQEAETRTASSQMSQHKT